MTNGGGSMARSGQGYLTQTFLQIGPFYFKTTIHAYIVYLHTHIHTYYICVYEYKHAYMHTYTNTYIHSSIHAYIHLYAYMNTYIHVQTSPINPYATNNGEIILIGNCKNTDPVRLQQ